MCPNCSCSGLEASCCSGQALIALYPPAFPIEHHMSWGVPSEDRLSISLSGLFASDPS